MELNNFELRVIGALLEKEVTTPEHYPLSLNALTNACNQKSNRDPVMDLTEKQVSDVLKDLENRNLVKTVQGFGSRVSKYQHRFCNTEFSKLKFTEHEKAIICVLFLRGAQTPGELRSRTARLANFGDTLQVEKSLKNLMSHQEGPFIERLEREPGKRESRYRHLFNSEDDQNKVSSSDQSASFISPESSVQETTASNFGESLSSNEPGGITDDSRIAFLEQKIEDLDQQFNKLKEQVDLLQELLEEKL